MQTISPQGGTKTTFVYAGDALIAEYQNGQMTHRYVHGGGTEAPLVTYSGSGIGSASRQYLHINHQGSVIAATSPGGVVDAINTYDAYGIPGDNNQGRFAYTGQLYLPSLGLYYYKARIYNPELGRFMQTDPVGYKDQMDMYAYVGNDPVNHTDPSGRCIEDACIVEGALVVAGVEALADTAIGAEVVAEGSTISGEVSELAGEVSDAASEAEEAITAKANPDGKTITDATGRIRGGSTDGPGAGKRITPKVRAAERQASGNRCIYCGRKTTNEPGKPNSSQGDHMQPKAGDRNGGAPANNSPENTGNSCATCNNDKSNQSLWHWVEKNSECKAADKFVQVRFDMTESVMVKLLVETDGNAWHGITAEWLWATLVGSELYRLENSPMYAYGLSYRDLVVARIREDNVIHFESVKDRGGHSTYRVLLNESYTKVDFDKYWLPAEQLGCSYESSSSPENVFSIDVPPAVDIYELYSLLEEGERAGVWEFEEGYCGHPLK